MDLIGQVDDVRLRERLQREWDALSREKKFGLVFERHLPELLPVYGIELRMGDLAARRDGPLAEFWRVKSITNGIASCSRADGSATTVDLFEAPVDELVVLKQFGDPIFPTLAPVATVEGGDGTGPWHSLIEADNYHALQLLEYSHGGKVDCIYIDPPYNTGARDWKYNNNYVDDADSWRHSKWLSFMERRLRIARKLLNPVTGVLIVTIDEHEIYHLGMLLEETFPECTIQTATIVINQKGVAQGRLARTEEYALFAFMPGAFLRPHHDDLLETDRSTSKRFQTPRWEWLLRGGTGARRADRHSLFYPIYIDPERRAITGVGPPLPLSEMPDLEAAADRTVAWPIRRDGSYGRWQVSPSSLLRLAEQGFVRLGGYDRKRNTWTVQYLNRGTRSRIEKGEIVVTGRDASGSATVEYVNQDARLKSIKTVWHRGLHDSGIYGSSFLKNIVGSEASFSFPKSIYATRDAIASVVRDRPDALILDFFAGSGTTLNAVNLINAADNGRRQCILVTNNEVSSDEADALRARGVQPNAPEWQNVGICQSVTWPRSKFTILGQRDNGKKLTGEYFLGKTAVVDKPRKYVHISFVSPEELNSPKKRAGFLALIPELPQKLAGELPYIVSEEHPVAVLFDAEMSEAWLSAVEGLDHISTVYVVATTKRAFDAIRADTDSVLSSLTQSEESKLPLAQGFCSNLAYFRLDFLEKDRIALKKAFAEILPVLWLKSGSVGSCPIITAPREVGGVYYSPTSSFAVLLRESAIIELRHVMHTHRLINCVYVVTDDDDAYVELSAEIATLFTANCANPQIFQLYRDYLDNFVINGAARIDTV